MSNDNTQDGADPSPASAGSVGSDLYGGGFNKWLASIGKTRETATDADDIQWLKLDRHRLNMLWRWIPVTERLPELRKVALGYNDEWAIPFAVLEYFGGRHPWVDAEGFFAEPTHWMPLPAPPTDGK